VHSLITIAPTLKAQEASLKEQLAKLYDHNKASDLAIEAVEAAYEAQLEVLAQEYDKTHAGGMQVQSVESGQDFIRYLERQVMLRSIDNEWIDYLTAMEDLRMNIGNMALAQRDPLVEFKRQGFTMFAELKENIQRVIVYDFLKNANQWQRYLVETQREAQRRLETAQAAGGSSSSVDEGAKHAAAGVRRATPKVGRNDPCPCGSGKKFKVCHLGREAELGGAQAGDAESDASGKGGSPAGKGPQPNGNGHSSDNGRGGAHTPRRSKGRNVPTR
jgi:preprotein translocase subunit SecA